MNSQCDPVGAMASIPTNASDEVRRRRRFRSTSAASAASTCSTWSHDAVDWNDHKKTHKSTVSSKPKASSSRRPSPSKPSLLLDLPPEILIHHLLPYLSYPALLALRLSHPYFYYSPLLYPARAQAISMRVTWLLERSEAGNVLVPTKSGSVDAATDERFLANPQVRELLRKERHHSECRRNPNGCRVVMGVTCGGPRMPGPLGRLRGELRRAGKWQRWGMVSALIAVVAMVTWTLRTFLVANA